MESFSPVDKTLSLPVLHKCFFYTQSIDYPCIYSGRFVFIYPPPASIYPTSSLNYFAT